MWVFVDETLPDEGASPDRILLLSCCEKACVEIRSDGKTVLKKSHKYYIQCKLQMAATETIKNFVAVWNPHGVIIDEIYFDTKFWYSIKNKFQEYYEHKNEIKIKNWEMA